MTLALPENHSLCNSCGMLEQFRLTITCARKVLALALLFFLAGAVEFAVAQDIIGRISGTVTDPSSAGVPNANITIRNEATKVARTLTADKNGYFVADALPIGTYTVSAEKPGFKVIVKNGNVLVAGGHLTVDLQLPLGLVSETVEVQASALAVNTASGEISTTLDTQDIQNAPLNERHYGVLVTLIPGAEKAISDQTTLLTSDLFGTNWANVNGLRADGNEYSVDGGYNIDSGSNVSAFDDVGVDFIREVSVQASNYSAEYGRMDGAQVNVVTKSGGNQFHGAAFEFVRNNIFDAANTYTKLSNPGAPSSVLNPAYRYNDWGWDAGGPIKRGKLFFFAGQEWKRLIVAQGQKALTVPTAAELGGNFADTGLTLTAQGSVPASCIGTYSGTKFVPGTGTGNAINPSCITGDGQSIANVYNVMETQASSARALTSSATGNNAFFQPGAPTNWREDIIRVDFQATSNQSLYFRYLHDNVDVLDAFGTFSPGGTLPTVPTDRRRPGYNYQIGYTAIITSHLVNEARFNADWHKQHIVPSGADWQRATYGFQFTPPLGLVGTFPTGIPYVQFTGTKGAPTSGPSLFTGPYFALLAPTVDIEPADNVTWQKASHTVKLGAMYARNRKNQNSRPQSYNGAVTFSPNGNPNTTGDAFADALLGNFQSFAQQSADPIGFYRFNDYEAYAEDTWKVTRKLTLDLGVRFMRTDPMYAQGNNITNFDPSQYNPLAAPVVAANGGLALNASGLGLCSGTIVQTGTPIQIGCDGLVRPGGVPSDQAGRVAITYQDPTLLAAIPPTAARGFYQPQSLWAPRVGFAFSPFDDNKTAIRGGFGMFYDKPEGNLLGGFGDASVPPWVTSVTYTNGNLADICNGACSTGAAPKPTAYGLGGTVDPNLKVAHTMQYSLSVERELPHGMLVQAAYVGNLQRHLLRAANINAPTWAAADDPANASLATVQIRPYLGYTDITQERSDATANYNSLQLSAIKRQDWWSFRASYTYSKALGNASGYNDNVEQECPFSCLLANGSVVTWKQFDYGLLDFDRRNIFSAAYSLEPPFWRNRKGIEGAVLSGWQLSGITQYQSGHPLTIQGTQVMGVGPLKTGYTRRVNLVSGIPFYSGFTCAAGKKCWFNPAAFALAPTNSAGDAPTRNILGPTSFGTDFSLRKTFNLSWEGMSLTFRADATNVFNQTNWGDPGTTLTSGGFGQISSANPPRQLQFGAKFSF